MKFLIIISCKTEHLVLKLASEKRHMTNQEFRSWQDISQDTGMGYYPMHKDKTVLQSFSHPNQDVLEYLSSQYILPGHHDKIPMHVSRQLSRHRSSIPIKIFWDIPIPTFGTGWNGGASCSMQKPGQFRPMRFKTL